MSAGYVESGALAIPLLPLVAVVGAGYLVVQGVNSLISSSKEVSGLIKDLNNDIAFLNKEKEIILLEHHTRNHEAKVELMTRLYASIDFDNGPFSQEQLDCELRTLNVDQKVALMQKVATIIMQFNQYEKVYQQLVDMSEKIDLDLTNHMQFYENLITGKLTNLHVAEIEEILNQQLNHLRNYISENETKFRQVMLSRKFTEFFYDLNHEIGSPLLYVLDDYYAELLHERKIDEKSLEKHNEVIHFKEELIKTMETISGLEFLGQDYQEALTLYKSGLVFFERTDLSDNDRYEFVKIRSKLLYHYQVSMTEKYKKLLPIKEQFDAEYRKYHYLRKYFNLDVNNFIITDNNIEQLLTMIRSENIRLEPQYEKRELMIKTRHKIRKALIKKMYLPLAQTLKTTTRGHIYQDFYQIGDGNVIVVNITESGLVNYQIKGVEIPGQPFDKNQVISTMSKVCPILEASISELLDGGEKGITKFYSSSETEVSSINLGKLPPKAQQTIVEQISQSERGIVLKERTIK